MQKKLSILEWYEKIGIDVKQLISTETAKESSDSETE